MARKSTSTLVRKAIWEVHQRKSPYSSEIIAWNELHIDHIIPVENSRHLTEAIARGIVDEAFDVNGLENLLPCHNHHNMRKSDNVFDEGTLRFFLNIAKQKKPEIEKFIEAETQGGQRLSAYLKMKAHAERNDVSVEDMFRFLRHEVEGEIPLRISPSIEGVEISSANSALASTLMDKPFFLGEGITTITLNHDDNRSLEVGTANEFLAATSDGYYPLTTIDIKAASVADETSQLLLAIVNSKFAKQSNIREPVITLRNLDRWEADWVLNAAMPEGEMESTLSQCKTIADVVHHTDCEVLFSGEWEFRVSFSDGLAVILRELMRADLDDDGFEEILVHHYVYAPEGTLGVTVRAKMDSTGLLRG